MGFPKFLGIVAETEVPAGFQIPDWPFSLLGLALGVAGQLALFLAKWVETRSRSARIRHWAETLNLLPTGSDAAINMHLAVDMEIWRLRDRYSTKTTLWSVVWALVFLGALLASIPYWEELGLPSLRVSPEPTRAQKTMFVAASVIPSIGYMAYRVFRDQRRMENARFDAIRERDRRINEVISEEVAKRIEQLTRVSEFPEQRKGDLNEASAPEGAMRPANDSEERQSAKSG